MFRTDVEFMAVSAVLSIGLGLWLAWVLVNRRFAGCRELGWVLTAALALPAPVMFAWLFFGAAGRWPWGLAIGTLLSAAPVVVFGGRLAFRSVDPVFPKTARSLGASDWRVFWRVELPLGWRIVLGASGLAFVRVLAEVGLIFVIAGKLPSQR